MTDKIATGTALAMLRKHNNQLRDIKFQLDAHHSRLAHLDSKFDAVLQAWAKILGGAKPQQAKKFVTHTPVGQWRAAKNLSQAEAARILGVSRATLRRWENSELDLTDPSAVKAQQIIHQDTKESE